MTNKISHEVTELIDNNKITIGFGKQWSITTKCLFSYQLLVGILDQPFNLWLLSSKHFLHPLVKIIIIAIMFVLVIINQNAGPSGTCDCWLKFPKCDLSLVPSGHQLTSTLARTPGTNILKEVGSCLTGKARSNVRAPPLSTTQKCFDSQRSQAEPAVKLQQTGLFIFCLRHSQIFKSYWRMSRLY